jgi:hypothetical protein
MSDADWIATCAGAAGILVGFLAWFRAGHSARLAAKANEIAGEALDFQRQSKQVQLKLEPFYDDNREGLEQAFGVIIKNVGEVDARIEDVGLDLSNWPAFAQSACMYGDIESVPGLVGGGLPATLKAKHNCTCILRTVTLREGGAALESPVSKGSLHAALRMGVKASNRVFWADHAQFLSALLKARAAAK